MNDKLKKVLAEVFNLKMEQISEHLTKEQISSWDSLRQMDLVNSLEEEFNITLEMEDIFKINSISTICEVLKEKGVL